MAYGAAEPGSDKKNTGEMRNRRRSERVLFRIQLFLSALLPNGNPTTIEVQSLIVNAHGGVLTVSMNLFPGQEISLTNIKDKLSAAAKVVRVKGSEDKGFWWRLNLIAPALTFGR
jgi:hypothetical protein